MILIKLYDVFLKTTDPPYEYNENITLVNLEKISFITPVNDNTIHYLKSVVDDAATVKKAVELNMKTSINIDGDYFFYSKLTREEIENILHKLNIATNDISRVELLDLT